jgi:colanic acid biosynthesis glycosyl transferase WcaI
MRILFLTPYFPPEVGAPQTRIYELALRLQMLGHEVQVLTTFPNYPSGIVPQQWRGKLKWKGSDQGIRVYRIWSYATPNKGFYRRVLSQLSFAGMAALGGLFLLRPDVVVVESPPLFDGFAGLLLRWVKRTPYIFNVADLWPETAVQLGMLRNPRLIWLSKKIELMFYRHAARVLAVTAGIRDAIVKDGIEPPKVLLFPNAVDTSFFRNSGDREMRRELGLLPEQFTVLYAGTLGLAHNLDTVLECAAMFETKKDLNVQFVLAGDGAEKEKLQARAREMGLQNLRFVGPYPKLRMPQLLNAADCILVSLRGVEIFRYALPTKMFEAMASEKPVVLAATGEAEDVVTLAGAGCCAVPGNASSLYEAIQKVRNNPDQAREMGQRGRQYVLRHFSRDQRARELDDLLKSLVGAEAQPPSSSENFTGISNASQAG